MCCKLPHRQQLCNYYFSFTLGIYLFWVWGDHAKRHFSESMFSSATVWFQCHLSIAFMNLPVSTSPQEFNLHGSNRIMNIKMSFLWHSRETTLLNVIMNHGLIASLTGWSHVIQDLIRHFLFYCDLRKGSHEHEPWAWMTFSLMYF